MKYIRTKNGIFDIEKYGGIRTITKVYDVDESLRLKYENTNEPQQVGDRTIFIEGKDYKITDNNTADTIEELCDEFVVAYEDGARIVYGDLEWAKVKAKASSKLGNKSIIYGAIWTEKSLTFVAKVNDEGELELL